MAVYCGVCASRVSSAVENGGAFPTNDFGGWCGNVADTCESCAAILRAAVANAARMILMSHVVRDRVEALRARLAEDRRREDGRERDEQFRDAWARERREREKKRASGDGT